MAYSTLQFVISWNFFQALFACWLLNVVDVFTCFSLVWDFKNSIIKKSVWQSQYKECKNVMIKNVSCESLWSISVVHNSFIILELWHNTAMLLWRKRKIRTSFKTLASKGTTIWWLKKCQRHDKVLEKITSDSYHME